MDSEYIRQLEETLKKFLTPVRDIPFAVVIKVLSGRRIIPIHGNRIWAEDFIAKLEEAIRIAGALAHKKGIRTKRPNKAGNKIENFVFEGLRDAGVPAQRPTTRSGKKKSAGYPDFELENLKHEFNASAQELYLPESRLAYGEIET